MWAGVVIGLLGIGIFAVWLIRTVPEFREDIDAMHRATPGESVDFDVSEPGRWTIFIEPSSASQSGLQYAVFDADGDPVSIGRAGSQFSYDWFGDSGRSIAAVDLDPGAYTLEVLAGRHTLAIGRSPGSDMFSTLLGGFLLAAPFVIGGATIAVVSAVRDTRRRTKRADPPAPSAWSSGEWPADSGR
ncbi:MAG: hypothetical protein P8J50_18210 [Acidimicrobiales bacterium]|jgi:hypothetical protein|nr:hypothetical protein [Acidimicrobiales bacterium]